MFKRLIPLILLFNVLACASATVQQRNLNSIKVLQRLDEFQDVVTDLYNTKDISPDHALLYSKFIVSATRTIQSSPDSWPTLVKASWAEVKLRVPFDKMELKVKVAANLLDVVLSGL